MNNFKLYFRTILKNKVFSLITIGGFAISLAVVILLFSFIVSENSFDKEIKDVDQIFRVITTNNTAWIPEQSKEMLEKEFSQVKSATNVLTSTEPIVYNKNIYNLNTISTDESFFSVFSLEIIKGMTNKMFGNEQNIIITESCAKKIFGNENPLGKTLNIAYRKDVTVVAIAKDIPSNWSIQGELFCSTKLKIRYRGSGNGTKNVNLYNQYVKLNSGVDIKDFEYRISPRIHSFFDWDKEGYKLQKYSDIYFDTSVENDGTQHANVHLIKLLLWLSLIILLMAIFNYTNLATAQSTLRLKEYGICEVYGANRNSVVRKFICEALLQVLLSFLLALVFAIILRPAFIEILGKEIELSILYYSLQSLIILILGVVLITILSGTYPAIVMMRKQPKLLLTKQLDNGKNSLGTKHFFNVIQFAASIALIISLITIVKQIEFVKSKDLGYNTEQLVQIPVHYKATDKLDAIKQEILKIPQVKSICSSHGIPGSIWSYNSNDDYKEVSCITSNHAFISTFEITILKGRNFFPDEKDNTCLINKTLEKQAGGWEKIEGKEIFGCKVIGVFNDFNYKDLYNTIGYLQICNGNDASHITIRLHPGNYKEVIQNIEKAFKKAAPEFEFTYSIYNEWLNNMYRNDENQAKAIRLLSLVAIILSGMGLYGLSMFSTKRRIKEIGIRRVNGARINEILRMLNFDLLKWLTIAFVIACPIAWYAMHKWLENFAYKTELSWWVFALAGSIALIIALLTVTWQSWRAATCNPVESLRYE